MNSEMRGFGDGPIERTLDRSVSRNDERGLCQVLRWTDPSTGESLSVEVFGTREFIAELMATGFAPCATPAPSGQAPRCYVSMEHASRIRQEPDRREFDRSGPAVGSAPDLGSA